MFTVCPKCALTLIVTAADLRAGQGYVRCGRCSNVFNALVSLSDDRESARPPTAASAPAPSAPATPESTPPESAAPESTTPESLTSESTRTESPAQEWNAAESHAQESALPGERTEAAPDPVQASETLPDDDPLADTQEAAEVGSGIEVTGTPAEAQADVDVSAASAADQREPDGIPDKDLEFNPASSNASDVFVEPEHGVAQAIGTGTFKMLVLRNKDFAKTLGLDDDEPEAPAGEALEASGERQEISDSLRNEVAAATESKASTLEWLQGREPDPVVPPRVRRMWSAGAAVLVLIFAMQLVNHYRDDLASVPALAPGMSGLYGALGVELHPDWDLAAYDVRQLGAAADPADAGSLRLRASIANRAARAQPLPLLRVTMQDRYGNPIAARDVEPAIYTGAADKRVLGAGERLDAQIVFHDPGRNAVGFELDACLPGAAGIVCALGQKPR